ncbi:DUF4097 family beta strand repeat-containing protein [Kitasatospora sp. NPDC051170]|uniref:DUF4097 family beta strand repeat-containing protein n=1 Tax=Kitasatospora sp. NPDC051170 TaxID=3364056 RepID=UPI00379B0021
MRHHRRYTGIVVVAVLATGLITACDPTSVTEKTFSDDATVSEKITAVRLDNSAGDLTVHGKSGTDKASVHRKVAYHNDKPGGSTRVENGVLVLGGCGKLCAVDYTVELPPGLPVTGSGSAGGIKLTQVGDVNVKTDHGDISVEDAGTVEVRTSNGDIKGTTLKGDHTTAKTDNGGIKITPGKAQNVKANTDNGDVTVVVPAGSYKVSAGTDIGEKHVGVTNDANAKFKIDIGSNIGDVTVKSG